MVLPRRFLHAAAAWKYLPMSLCRYRRQCRMAALEECLAGAGSASRSYCRTELARRMAAASTVRQAAAEVAAPFAGAVIGSPAEGRRLLAHSLPSPTSRVQQRCSSPPLPLNTQPSVQPVIIARQRTSRELPPPLQSPVQVNAAFATTCCAISLERYTPLAERREYPA